MRPEMRGKRARVSLFCFLASLMFKTPSSFSKLDQLASKPYSKRLIYRRSPRVFATTILSSVTSQNTD